MYWSSIGAAANAAAYQTGQTGYQMSHTPTAAGAYTAQRATGTAYDTSYQTAATHTSAAATYPTAAAAASTTYDYAYGRPAQTAATAVAYDTSSKSYYAAQPTAAAAAAATVSYTTAETHYQNLFAASKNSYSNASMYPTTTRTVNQPVISKTTYAPSLYTSSVPVSTSSYNASMYTPQTTTSNKGAASSSMYNTMNTQPTVQQNISATKPQTNTWQTNFPNKKTNNASKSVKPKPPPKPQQLHYCDVCKISCAGPQTYREHLEGQKHKKKEAAMKTGTTPVHKTGANLRCELCDVTCNASHVYAAHIRGAKHQKVVKLHQKLGKPIPANDPVLETVTTSSTTKSSTTTTGTTSSHAKNNPSAGFGGSSNSNNAEDKDEGTDLKEVEPVGQEFIEEIRNEEDKIISFNCKLCECKFNDIISKENHMKGRRHRRQYKKNVNPDLVVDMQPATKMRNDMWKKVKERQEDGPWGFGGHEHMEWGPRFPRGPGFHPPMPGPYGRPFIPPYMGMRRSESSEDRHVVAKHSEIYPPEDELNSIQKIVSHTERALKLVSDYLSESDAPKKPVVVKTEKKDDKKDSTKKDEAPRMLKGVMRVGILAKGLLLKGDNRVQLVVLCGDKPTRSLLGRVADNLPKQFTSVAPDEKYEVVRAIKDASIIVQTRNEENKVTVSVVVTLTSPVMREQPNKEEDNKVPPAKDPHDILDKQKCLSALAALRHAKWFQAKAYQLPSCVIVIRVLRDICQRLPVWTPFTNNYLAMELLCEKVIGSAGHPLSPGESFRRVFEALASGILLPGTPGLMDPCEKDPTDALASIPAQARENITASAMHALRLISFRQIHKVLGIDALPFPKYRGQRFPLKRRRDNSSGEGNDTEENGKEGKKDKKEDVKMETK